MVIEEFTPFPFYLSMPIDSHMTSKSGCILCIKNISHKNTKHQKASLFTYFFVVLSLFHYSSLIFVMVILRKTQVLNIHLQLFVIGI